MKKILQKEILPKVEKPLRYIGNEWNVIKKDWDSVDLRAVFAFPDTYEVGMSHLGSRILYHLINEEKNMLMERVFAPWVDIEDLLEEYDLPLFSLESTRPLDEFDVFAVTLQYEMSFTNILNMLDMARIPLKRREREDKHPLVIAGGPCAANPEPISDFIDCFVIGEGEEVLVEVFQAIATYKKEKKEDFKKKELLKILANIEGIYVPEFFEISYHEDGKIASIECIEEGVPKTVHKRFIKDMDKAYFPTKPIVPYLEIVHDRAMVEVLRGCTRGCRFCQAGSLYRPVRERSPELLKEQVEKLLESTGYDEVSLTSLSSSDYSCIEKVLKDLLDKHGPEGVGVSLPSLRIDSFSMGIANQIQRVRKSSLTFAPEAGTQRLRDVINKGVTEEDLIDVVTGAFEQGWVRLKLYFMIGLPTETKEDLDGIRDLAYKVLEIGDRIQRENERKGPKVEVTISVAGFVPKSNTPFQFEPHMKLEELEEKQRYLGSIIRNRRIKYNYHDARLANIEAIFARGDRLVGKALYRAWEKGCKFDSWSRFFDYEKWLEAFEEVGINPYDYSYRKYEYEDILPWEHIKIGLRKEYFVREHKAALEAKTTGDCRFEHCSVCGVCQDYDIAVDLKGGPENDSKN